ncbi:uncharacterized protein LOC130665595 [Microplitis mediator]|uniref:uncharacterized protein LOC130665595 n=1 Tax=Microplitis mediator TaxID=375433 RepID=UPI0025544CD6|nr:uncharacterized protein LOC130665595 [Microplitis mediator]
MEDTKIHRFSASERFRKTRSGWNERVPRGSNKSDRRFSGPRTLSHPPRQPECQSDKRKKKNLIRHELRTRKYQTLLEANNGKMTPELVKLWHHVATPQVVALTRITGSAPGICSSDIWPSNSTGLPKESREISHRSDEHQHRYYASERSREDDSRSNERMHRGSDRRLTSPRTVAHSPRQPKYRLAGRRAPDWPSTSTGLSRESRAISRRSDEHQHRYYASERSREDESRSNERLHRGSDRRLTSPLTVAHSPRRPKYRLAGRRAPDWPSTSTGLPKESREKSRPSDEHQHRYYASERSREDDSRSNERLHRGSDRRLTSPRTVAHSPRRPKYRLAGRRAPDWPSTSTGLPKESREKSRPSDEHQHRYYASERSREDDSRSNERLHRGSDRRSTGPRAVAHSPRQLECRLADHRAPDWPSTSTGLPEESGENSRPSEELQLEIRVSPPAVIEEKMKPFLPPPPQPYVLGIVDPWREYRGKKNRKKRRKTFHRQFNWADAEWVCPTGSPKSPESGIEEIPAFDDLSIDVPPMNSDDELVMHDDEGVGLDDADL